MSIPIPESHTATNLFKNPDMQATAGDVVVWENLSPDPRMEVKPSDTQPLSWTGSSGDFEVENISGSRHPVNWVFADLPKPTNGAMTGLVTVKNTSQVPLFFRIRAHDGAYNDDSLRPAQELQPGETADIVESFSFLSNINLNVALRLYCVPSANNIDSFGLPSGGTFKVSRRAAIPVAWKDPYYFDETFSPDPDLTPQPRSGGGSQLVGQRVAGMTATNGVVVQSDEWARLINTTDDETFATADGIANPVTGKAIIDGQGETTLPTPDRIDGPTTLGDDTRFRLLTITDTEGYGGPPFSPSTPPFEYKGQTVYPQWDGTPHDSTSSFNYFEPLTSSGIMPIDIWHSPGEKRYEIGVEKGMVYVDGVGQPWPGLVSVEKTMPTGEVESRYIDGVKYRVDIPPTDFSATIEAFTYPDMFEECLGSVEHDDIRSLRVNDQMARPFGMAYRTLIGDDILGPNRGYKLHLVYNAYALRSMSRHETLGEMMQASNFTWDIHTVPVALDGFRRTSYFTIDSTKENPILMSAIESTLYGFGSNPPMMPTIQEIIDFLS